MQRAASGNTAASVATPNEVGSDPGGSGSAGASSAQGGPAAARTAARAVQTAAEALPTFSPKSVGRIAVEAAGGVHWPGCGGPAAERGLLSMLMGLKAAVRGTRCANAPS